MAKIIDGYIIKQISKNFLSCQLGMAFLFWLYSITIFLGTSNADIVTLPDCLSVSLLKTTISLGILIPLSLYFSIIISFGHFNQTSELIAMNVLTYPKRRIYFLVSLMSTFILIITSIETIVLRPLAYSKLYNIKDNISQRWEFDKLNSGQFYISDDGSEVIFTTKTNDQLQNVFIKLKNGENIEIFTSETGNITNSPENDMHIIKMQKTKYLKDYFNENSIVGNFKEIEIHIEQKIEKNIEKRIKETSTQELFNSKARTERAELQWRICLPFSVIFLTIACYFILRIEPRNGKFANLPVAIILYSTYYVAIGLARSWVEQGVISNIFYIPVMFILFLYLYYGRIKKVL